MINSILKKASPTISGIIVISGFVFVLANSSMCSSAVSDGLNLILGYLIPALYFQIIISKIIYNSGILRKLPFVTSKTQIIILGLLGGYTVGSLLANEAKENGEISDAEQKALGYSLLCAGPSLIIGGIGQKLLNNAFLGVLIYLSSALSQIVLYLIIQKPSKTLQNAPKTADFSEVIVSSVNSSTMAIMKLSGFVLLFSAISYIICNIFNFNCNILGIKSERLLSYFLESTYATRDIITSGSKFSLYLIVFFLNFGGFSLIFQVKSNIKGLKLLKLILSKTIIGLLSVLFCFILLKIFPITNTTIAGFSKINLFYSNAPASAFLLIFACYTLCSSMITSRKNYHK